MWRPFDVLQKKTHRQYLVQLIIKMYLLDFEEVLHIVLVKGQMTLQVLQQR